MKITRFLPVLALAGCVGHVPVAGMTPDMGWRDAAWTCSRESFDAVPSNSGVMLAGIAVGGALGGAVAGAAGANGDTASRTAYYHACFARHGWRED